ncbi:MAG: P27 family phage terminase small subunit [Desulfovibrio sp.]|jgi:P27 family predicted phage terminase small subunit|nr:P27 family phage terminase small subunit [Desulfovibrio sp.]
MCQEKAAESFTLFQKIIAEMGNDSATFAHGMSLMALLWADMEQLQAEVAAEGWTLETETARGSVEVKTNPKVKLLRDIQKELRMWFAEFGLTPSSIQRVGQQKQQEKNIFEKFLEH